MRNFFVFRGKYARKTSAWGLISETKVFFMYILQKERSLHFSLKSKLPHFRESLARLLYSTQHFYKSRQWILAQICISAFTWTSFFRHNLRWCAFLSFSKSDYTRLQNCIKLHFFINRLIAKNKTCFFAHRWELKNIFCTFFDM